MHDNYLIAWIDDDGAKSSVAQIQVRKDRGNSQSGSSPKNNQDPPLFRTPSTCWLQDGSELGRQGWVGKTRKLLWRQGGSTAGGAYAPGGLPAGHQQPILPSPGIASHAPGHRPPDPQLSLCSPAAAQGGGEGGRGGGTNAAGQRAERCPQLGALTSAIWPSPDPAILRTPPRGGQGFPQ